AEPFLFQAEDGIRDFHVTGVQTCALPILPSPISRIIFFTFAGAAGSWVGLQPSSRLVISSINFIGRYLLERRFVIVGGYIRVTRSEERRVGKEWRGGG